MWCAPTIDAASRPRIGPGSSECGRVSLTAWRRSEGQNGPVLLPTTREAVTGQIFDRLTLRKAGWFCYPRLQRFHGEFFEVEGRVQMELKCEEVESNPSHPVNSFAMSVNLDPVFYLCMYFGNPPTGCLWPGTCQCRGLPLVISRCWRDRGGVTGTAPGAGRRGIFRKIQIPVLPVSRPLATCRGS